MCTPNQENFFINQIEMQPAFIDSQIFVIQVYVIYVSMPILCKYAVFIDNIFPSALPGNFSAGPNNTTGLNGFLVYPFQNHWAFKRGVVSAVNFV